MQSLNLILAVIMGSFARIFEIPPQVMGGGEASGNEYIRLNFKISNTVIDYEVSTSGIKTHELYESNLSYLTLDSDVDTFKWDITDVYGRDVTCTTDLQSTLS